MAALLVVEDEPDMRALVVGILSNDGHRVDEAADGTEALRLLAEKQYDLAVFDVRMPDTRDIGFIAGVHTQNPQMPIVVLSGYLLDREVQALQELGISAVLRKPLDNIERLRSMVSGLIKPSR